MKVRIKLTWRWLGMLPKYSVVFGYENNSQKDWHYHILYIGLIIVIFSWGSF